MTMGQRWAMTTATLWAVRELILSENGTTTHERGSMARIGFWVVAEPPTPRRASIVADLRTRDMGLDLTSMFQGGFG
jgi:hypothetical protein